MKNKIIIFFCLIFINSKVFADNIFINSKNITLDKNNQTTIFQGKVNIKTDTGYTIESDYAEYNKQINFIKLKNKIRAADSQGNVIETEYAEYDGIQKKFISKGPTKIITSENYIIETIDVFIDDTQKIINSDKETVIIDQEKNKIYLENFNYHTDSNIFKSIGLIKIKDKIDNVYEFSQIYIDTKKKEILGTDIKAYMNSAEFKVNENNKPRIFGNTLNISNSVSTFNKSVFTLCDYRKNDACPPWSIQASKMLHDSKKKTIYYDNAVIKFFDIPIFYLPKLSHPDPTVNRKSGFLPPSFSDTKNLGASLTLPYFWALSDDKNLTITNRLFVDDHPLVLGEYHQAFKNSTLLANFGYTGGYKNSTPKKKQGDKSHLFSRFIKNFNHLNDSTSKLDLNIQHISNDKYLKLYKIKSNLIDYNKNTLENSIDITHENEDLFIGFHSSIYETLNESYEDKYEYILPEITLDKNLINNNKIGSIDLGTNYKAHTYDTNKFTNFLVNDLNWNSNEINYKSGINGKFLGKFRNINYETKNVDIFKKDATNEFYGALGYLSEIILQKQNGSNNHLLKPKILARYAPGSMRKETSGSRLKPTNAFNIERTNNNNNFETGLTGTIGFDYEIKNKNNIKEFDFSVAQIISEKENKKMSSESSMDEKLSDLVGSTNYKINNNLNLKYNFAVDQNYNEFNYNEIGAVLDLNPIKIDFNYLQEDKHIGNQEYIKTKIDFAKNNNGLLSFETKRNLIKNSSEFYNLSYEYINDCLRAGLVYRREFYNDSELEPEDSLMFKITLVPFGNIKSPSFSQ
jgi:LPS-assembly protein